MIDSRTFFLANYFCAQRDYPKKFLVQNESHFQEQGQGFSIESIVGISDIEVPRNEVI